MTDLRIISIFVCIIGFLIWHIVVRMKAEQQPLSLAETGKIMFWIGLLAFFIVK
jgi:hypothetical protein